MVLELRSKALDLLQALPQTCRVSLHLSLTQTSVRSLLTLTCRQSRTVSLQVLLKRRDKRLPPPLGPVPGARFPSDTGSSCFCGKSAGWLCRVQGKRQPVMGTRITRPSTLKVDNESKGDDGWHLLNLYCLPGMRKCPA